MPAPANRREYLERLIMGLEQAVETQRFELPYYKEGDVQGKYAKKFLEAVEQQLKDARAELEALDKASSSGGPPQPPVE